MNKEHIPNPDMPPLRYPFSVKRSGETAFITMDCGRGVMRLRHMPVGLLDKIGELCLTLMAEVAVPDATVAPLFPAFLLLGGGGIPGVCSAAMGVHRLEDGTVERVIALYDEGDFTFPVLVLAEEQIDEFINLT